MEKLKLTSGLTSEEKAANEAILRMRKEPKSHNLWFIVSRSLAGLHNDPNIADIAQNRVDKIHRKTGCPRHNRH